MENAAKIIQKDKAILHIKLKRLNVKIIALFRKIT